MDPKTILGIASSLLIAGVMGGLAIYKEVGVTSQAVGQLAKDLDQRDLRERGQRDSLIRLEERHACLAARVAP